LEILDILYGTMLKIKKIVDFYISFTGIIYDVIVEPPSVGSTTDEHGHTRPVSWKNLYFQEFASLNL